MKRIRAWSVPLSALVALTLLAGAARAAKSPVAARKSWYGSVADTSLMRAAPPAIASTAELKRVWRAWRVMPPVPKVDWTRELVLSATTRGSRLRLVATLDEKGNLRVDSLATKDLRPGFRYALALVSRKGVKSVNGKPLPALKSRRPTRLTGLRVGPPSRPPASVPRAPSGSSGPSSG